MKTEIKIYDRFIEFVRKATKDVRQISKEIENAVYQTEFENGAYHPNEKCIN